MSDEDFNRAADQPLAPAELNARQRLRAFEDKVFGEETTRIEGKVERGHGSFFARMTPGQQREYAALERLVAAEQKLADATAALAQGEADHETALNAVAATEGQSDGTSE